MLRAVRRCGPALGDGSSVFPPQAALTHSMVWNWLYFCQARVWGISNGQAKKAGVVAGTGAAALVAAQGVARANDEAIPPPQYPWNHSGPFSSFDVKSIRRGYQVYKEVCSTCHSMRFIRYRNLVGVIYTEEEAKQLASEIEVEDGPNDEGEMFERPGKLSDPFPSPYENEGQARAMNNGALPPDLSIVSKARHGGEDYIFALLTGYKEEPPAGVVVNEAAGQYYNPYFAGSKIGMPKPLMDESVEYEDGTEASESQMAKDVATFLAWAAEPHNDTRKREGQKFFFALCLMAALAGYHKRLRWAPLKTRRLSYFK